MVFARLQGDIFVLFMHNCAPIPAYLVDNLKVSTSKPFQSSVQEAIAFDNFALGAFLSARQHDIQDMKWSEWIEGGRCSMMILAAGGNGARQQASGKRRPCCLCVLNIFARHELKVHTLKSPMSLELCIFI